MTPDPDLVSAPLPAGLHKYKYDSAAGAWTEGASTDEITAAAAEDTKAQLAALDNPRDAEAVFEALKAKGILADTDLAAHTLVRFQQKSALRAKLG